MKLQVVIVGKSIAALLALIRFLTRVGKLVSFQSAVVHKAFMALLAFVRFLVWVRS